MDAFSLLIGLALAAGLILFISQPLRRARRTIHIEPQIDALQAQYESLLVQIRELDFDHATGKVVYADYEPLRARLKSEAADALRQIDALTGAMPASAALSRLEAAPETSVAARRKREPATTESIEAELEAAIAARRKTPKCPNCGKPSRAGDAFCSRCGTPLGTRVAR